MGVKPQLGIVRYMHDLNRVRASCFPNGLRGASLQHQPLYTYARALALNQTLLLSLSHHQNSGLLESFPHRVFFKLPSNLIVMPPNVIDLTDASSSPTHTTPRKAQSTAPEGPEPTTSALLEQAICNASQSRLQHTLREICGVNPAASRTACDLLLVDNECVKYLSAEESSQEEDSSEAEEEEADEDDSTGKK